MASPAVGRLEAQPPELMLFTRWVRLTRAEAIVGLIALGCATLARITVYFSGTPSTTMLISKAYIQLLP